MKVLFQSSNPHTFRATLVGYLYEISQKHEVVLLTGELDSYTGKVLGDKNLFPGLGKIIFFDAPFYGDIFRKNYRLCRVSKKVIQDYKPDIVITPEDFWPMSLYLLRFAKKVGILTLALQDGFRINQGKKLYQWSCLMNAYNKMPSFLTFQIRLLLVKIKKYLGHFFYYWILPTSAGQMPFPGKTSFVFWDTSPGLRDADYSAVFSKRDYELSIRDGIPSEKLFIIGHPLEHKSTKEFFNKTYFSRDKRKEQEKTLAVMWPEEKVGLRKKDYSLLPEDKMRESRLQVTELISEKLADWEIFIKPHPSEKQTAKIKEFLGHLSNVVVVEPSESADQYIEKSQVIIGFPPPSTTLFTASVHLSDKIILYLDMNQELLGDSYKDFDGIDYVDSEEKFMRLIDSIKNETYRKKQSSAKKTDFSDAAELIDHIYAKRVS